MFSGYNLSLDKDFFNKYNKSFEEYMQIGRTDLSNSICDCRNVIEENVKYKFIDGTIRQHDWFPKRKADIFISHSHNDEDLANALAGWIYDQFELKVFMDSNVWGYSDDLLEKLNEKYSNAVYYNDGDIVYNHYSCNEVSKHVNTMLSIALQKMIDNVECIILLNTNNSVSVFDENEKCISSTYSPWIYTEIVCTQIVRKKPLLLYRDYPKKFTEGLDESSYLYIHEMKVSYDISLSHLQNLEEIDLNLWCDEYHKYESNYKKYPLDALYHFNHNNELVYTKNLFANNTHSVISRIKNQFTGHGNDPENDLSLRLCLNCEYCKCRNCLGTFHRIKAN